MTIQNCCENHHVQVPTNSASSVVSRQTLASATAMVPRHGGWRFWPRERHGADGRMWGKERTWWVSWCQRKWRGGVQHSLGERENKPPLRSFPVLRLYDPGLQLRNQCQTLEASPTEVAGSDHWWHESSTLQLRHTSTLLEASPRHHLFRALPFEILLWVRFPWPLTITDRDDPGSGRILHLLCDLGWEWF